VSGPPFGSPVGSYVHPLGYHRTGSEFVVTRDCAGHRATNQGCALDIGNGRCDGKVYAVEAGNVVYTQALQGIVRIDHGGGWRSDYAHMVPILVKVGQRVALGQQIGEVGDAHDPAITNFSGCHLHFATVYNGTEVDPWPLLAQNAAEDSMKPVPGSQFHHIHNKRTSTRVTANWRADRFSDSPVLRAFPAGTGCYPVVRADDGTDVGGNTQWFGCWMYDDSPSGYAFGWFHRSTLVTPFQDIVTAPADTTPFSQDDLDAAKAAGAEEGKQFQDGVWRRWHATAPPRP
jgi:hypothetical protein